MEAGDSNYNDNFSDYSEDFEEEEEAPESEVRMSARPSAVLMLSIPQRLRGEPARNTKSHPSPKIKADKATWRSQGTRVFSEPRHKGSKQLTPYRLYGKGKSPSGQSPRDRLLSSKMHAIRALQNELAETKRELDEFRKENQLLNRLQVRQERELTKLQSQEGELPQILFRHAEEVRSLREQLKRSQEVSGGYQRKMNDLRQELQRVSDRKRKLEEVVRRRHLLERETLTVQLQEANDSIEDKNRRIAELERRVELVGRNRAQEVKSLLQRNKSLAHEMEELKEYTQKMHMQLRGKEKEMDVMNIYSQRIGKNAPQHLPPKLHPSPVTTENSESQTNFSCPPFKTVSLQTKPPLKTSASQTDMRQPTYPTTGRLVPTGTQTDTSHDPGRESADVVSPSKTAAGTSAAIMPQQTSPVRTVKQEEKLTNTLGGSSFAVTGAREAENKKGLAGEEERQKKDALLARLRAIDGQKGPPSSEPVPTSGGVTKSVAETTASITVGGRDHPSSLSGLGGRSRLGGSSSKPPLAEQQLGAQVGASVTRQADSEAQKKKQLLLAKLMAIDDRNRAEQESSLPQKPVLKQTEPVKSNSSLNPDIVENMHNGKPAFATADDPFGSRHSIAKKHSGSAKSGKDPVVITERETEIASQRVKFGRRQEHELSHKFSSKEFTSKSRDAQAVSKSQVQGDYKPSFGRRAVNASKATNDSLFGGLEFGSEPVAINIREPGHPPSDPFTVDTQTKQTRDYPWETRVNMSPKALNSGANMFSATLSKSSDSYSAGHSRFTSVENGSKKPTRLDLRPKAGINSFDAMPGAIVGEPDDLEELVL